MKRPVVIGIAGGSGSGKTTVIRRITEALDPSHIAVIEHDAYYKDLRHLPEEDRLGINFDHPDSLETALLLTHIKLLLKGQSIDKPKYDYNRHLRHEETVPVDPKPIIIVDGILVLAEPALAELMDIKIFVETDGDVRLLRRIRRDIEERGRSIENILTQYEKTVRPMYVQFVEPSKRRADVIIPRGGHNLVAIKMVVARINNLLGDKVETQRNSAVKLS